MAIKAKVTAEEHSKLSQALQGEYTKQTDGSFVLAVESVDGFALENITGLKGALSSERTTAAQLKAQIEAFKDIDPTKAREAMQRLAELGDVTKLKGEDKVNAMIAQVKAELEGKIQTQTKTFSEREGLLMRELNRFGLEAAARDALKQFGVTETAELLMPHVMRSLRLIEKGGKFVAAVVDEHGNERITAKTGDTSPMGVVEYVESMRQNPVYKSAFPAQQKAGSGSQPVAPSNGGGGTEKLSGTRMLEQALGSK